MPLILATRRVVYYAHRSGLRTSFALRPGCGDIYTPSERHGLYKLHRGCSYAVAVFTTPGDVYAFLRPIATCRTLSYV